MTENEDKCPNNNLKRLLILEIFISLKYELNTNINLYSYLRLYYWNILALLNMKFISEDKISEELINSFDEEMTLELAKRLEEDNYIIRFDSLKDWDLLRALEINSPELKTNYVLFIDQEPFYEN